jgi:hypothetical protein
MLIVVGLVFTKDLEQVAPVAFQQRPDPRLERRERSRPSPGHRLHHRRPRHPQPLRDPGLRDPSATSLRINAQSSKVITLQSLSSVHFSSVGTV